MSATFDSLALAQLLPMMKRPRRFDVRQTDRAAPQAVRHVYSLVQPHGAGAAAAPTPAPQPETAGALLRAAADAAAAKSFPALPEGLGGEGIVEAVPGPWGGPVAAGGDAMRRAVEALVEAKAAKLLQLLRTILFNQVRPGASAGAADVVFPACDDACMHEMHVGMPVFAPPLPCSCRSSTA